MRHSPYRTISVILKVVVILLGAYCIVLGFLIAIMGRSIECNEPPWWIRLIAAVILLEGLAYLVPTRLIMRSRGATASYLGFTLLPVLGTIALAAAAAFIDSWDTASTESQIATGMILVFLIAPFSLIFSILQDWREKADKAHPE